MRLLLLISTLLFASSGRSQTVADTAIYRFVYDAQLRVLKKKDKLYDDEHYLDICKNGISRYYSAWQERRREITDSISALGGNISDIQRCFQEKGVETSDFSYDIMKNYPQRNEQTVTYTTAQRLQYSEPSGMEWTLEDGDSTVLGYPCMKASTVYHGRRWTVWYTREIGISDGPWKLCGLPGLILNARDSEGDYIFNCIGMERPKGKLMTIQTYKTIKTTPKKAHQTIEFIENDPIGYLNLKGNNARIEVNGNSIKIDQKDLKRVYIEYYR